MTNDCFATNEANLALLGGSFCSVLGCCQDGTNRNPCSLDTDCGFNRVCGPGPCGTRCCSHAALKTCAVSRDCPMTAPAAPAPECGPVHCTETCCPGGALCPASGICSDLLSTPCSESHCAPAPICCSTDTNIVCHAEPAIVCPNDIATGLRGFCGEPCSSTPAPAP